ncbi:hypothetical protein HDU79_007274 [Rhizoclosmatium sp. JEL0117]|nr:hypothetical protein HDU79_007274 [Rhizoclosmatium sp. JEL0117]
MAATNNAGGGGTHRENVWSFVSDVSTGDEDHTLDDDFNENDRIFDTALKQGASFMQFPFSFKIPNTLPPSISPSPSAYVVESSCPQCTVLLDQQNGIEKPGLVKYPQYEVMAMLSFESFAVSAYQVVSAGIPVTRGVEDDVVFSELTKGEGTLGAGAFRYKYWDAPKYSVLNSQTKFDFKLQLTSAATDLSKIESVSMRPVYRYKHITAPEAPTQQTSHLYTPFQSTTQFPIRTINLSPTTFTSTTIPITLPTLPFPYPSAKNLGAWTLENALEVAITYRNPTNPVGSLSRIMKPPHNHAVHHAEGGYIQQAEGTRTAFLCIPVQVVHPYTPSPASPLKTADERQDLEALMDRVEASGVTAGGTVSCLFSAKKLVRIGLRDWVDAGRDDEISVVPGASGYMEEEFGVAAYRSDAKPKMTGPVGVAPPIPPVPTPPTSIPTSATSPAVTSPVIPTRGISAITVPAELNAPSIPARNTSSIGGVSKALSKDKNRKSIASSLNLTEITASTPIVIPKRAQSQPRKIFLDGKSGVGGAGLLPLTRGIGPGGPGVRGVGVNAARNGPLPPLPPGQQAIPQVMASRSSMLSDANTVSTNVNSQWGSGIPGSINREQFEAASIGSSEEDIVASILDSNAYGDEEEFFSTNGADDSHISFHDNNGDQYGAPPQKKQVTFNETLEMFSAKSVAWTDSTISDYDPNNVNNRTSFAGNKVRTTSMLGPSPAAAAAVAAAASSPTTPPPSIPVSTSPSPAGMTAEEAARLAQEFTNRMSLTTQVEQEILFHTPSNEERGVSIEYGEPSGSMIPGGRGVISGPGGGGGSGAGDFGRPLRYASVPRHLVDGKGPANAGAGGSVPGPGNMRPGPAPGGGGLLSRMVGNVRQAVTGVGGGVGGGVASGSPSLVQQGNRNPVQERSGAGGSMGGVSVPGSPPLGGDRSASASPVAQQKGPVVIAPRTSSARWTE